MIALALLTLIVVAGASDWGPGSNASDAVRGLNTPRLRDGPDRVEAEGAIVAVVPEDGCKPFENDVAGKVALIAGDGCYPQTKVRHAQSAGAVAALVKQYRTTPGLLYYYNNGRDNGDLRIPAVEIENAAYEDMLGAVKTQPSFARVSEDPNPLRVLDDWWTFYTVFFLAYDALVLATALPKLRSFVRERGWSADLPKSTLSFEVFIGLSKFPPLRSSVEADPSLIAPQFDCRCCWTRTARGGFSRGAPSSSSSRWTSRSRSPPTF